MGGKTQTSTSTNTPTALPQLQDVWNRVQQAASTPYTPYGGPLVAGLNTTQQAGINNTNSAVGTAQPYLDQAATYGANGAAAISPNDIARYTNPYTNSVIQATQNQFNNQNAQQASGLKSSAIQAGAFGGDRAGVAQAELANQQNLAQAPVIASLNNQNFQQALQAAQQDRAAQAQGAYTFANLGGASQNAALQGAQAQLGAGAVQQGTEQNQLSADYNQYLQQLAFPYQQAQFLSSNLPVLTAQGGQTANTTPGPNPWVQGAGLALSAASLASDERVKKNIVRIGETYDGQPIYRFEYKGDNTPRIGLMAQDVEKRTPEAVGESNGVKTVNYGLATSRAAKKGHFASGGVVNFMDTPTYIPIAKAIQATSPYAAPAMQASQPQQSFGFSPQLLQGAAKGGKNLLSQFGFGGDSAGSPGYNTSPEMGGAPVGFDANGGSFNFNGFDGGGFADGGFVGAIHSIRHALKRGGRAYADGGPISFDERWGDLPTGPALPDDGAGSERAALAFMSAPRATPEATQAWRDSTDFAQRTPEATAGIPVLASAAQGRGGLPPEITSGGNEPPNDDMPPGVLAYGPGPQSSPYAQPSAEQGAPQAQSAQTMGGFNPLGLSDDARQGLLAAGLGIAASKSPFALSAIGEGGLQGAQTYAQAKKTRADQALAQRRVDLTGQQLAQQAEQFAKNLDLNERKLKESTRQHDVTALQPVKIGVDALGQEVYGIRDPQNGQIKIIDSRTGQPKVGQPAIASGDTAAEPLVGDAYLKSLPVEQQQLVKKIANYEIDPRSLSTRGGHREQLLAAAGRYNADFDQVNYPARAAAVKDFGNGKKGDTIRSFDVGISHLNTLDDLAKALNNGDTKVINKISNYFKEQTGRTAPGNFDAAKSIVGDEIVKSIIGSGAGALGDREEIKKNIDNAKSYGQLADVIKTYKTLMAGQLHGIRKQYEATTGLKNFDSKLSDETKKELLAPPEASGPKIGDTKQFKQGVGVWDGKQWVPKVNP